ncbi:uncharacterized protein Eint_051100 [Encephalitozoon intestinalis ATCC 50506]|uniref:Uncharacterized protein n=1 Tax=Encephalitozoon intestinalis (strain ATCC 50506) TaxID=876142 RepID=E0S6X1_ENCIT|nr:uncharacterized protein Eint_051100 [Encephalitozoon intestinalis ATCC 50506]ADM11557.1 hypothetical protein Eint_051100 [Encephalitozoon intestinalis ATCC 50506]UTX45271.1 RNA polymerase III subunit RPC9 [Encephalitozoon intestinalis]
MKITGRIRLLSKIDALDIIDNSMESHPGQTEFLEKVRLFCTFSMTRDKAGKVREALMNMGLTEFESIQLIDLNPRSIVCLQLVIEDMEERFSEGDLFKILGLFENDK